MARKAINAATAGDHEAATKILARDVRGMAAVTHPNIVRLLGVCTERHKLALLMEYAELGTLRDRLDEHRTTPFDASRRKGILHGVIEGVRRLHAHTPKPIVHCD